MSAKRLNDTSFVADDSILVLGKGTTIFGDMLEDFKSPLQATVIDRLEAEGATLKASVNFKDVVKILLKDKLSFGLGFDTDGSAIQTASQNNLFGYKPTYGMISRNGIVSMVSSMDTVSLLANSIDQIELICKATFGSDGCDSMLFSGDEFKSTSKNDYKIGLVTEFCKGDNKNLAKLKANKVSLSMAKYILPIYHTIMPAEISSNMMQYDGVRYGKRPETAKTLQEIYTQSRTEGFNKETKLNIMVGFHVLSTGLFEAYFVQAAKARTMLINELDKLFEKYDLLVGSADSEDLAIAAYLAGLPMISLPNGMQIVAPQKSDKELINFARELKNERSEAQHLRAGAGGIK